jgi:hypothetical protein
MGLQFVSRILLMPVCNMVASVPAHGRAWRVKEAGRSEALHDGV